MATDYSKLKAEGQFDKFACWAACLSWWLRALGDGKPALSQAQLISEFNNLCDDNGALPPSKFKHNVCTDARFKISMNFFSVSWYRQQGLPILDLPVIVVYNYPDVGGTHMNVIFDKQWSPGNIYTYNCMEPYFPMDAKDGKRSGTYVRRATSHFLNSQEIGLAWPTVKFSEK